MQLTLKWLRKKSITHTCVYIAHMCIYAYAYVYVHIHSDLYVRVYR